ncbi:MAG: hypothetical protein AAF485_24040, partial [Chloroflexota bacterium]
MIPHIDTNLYLNRWVAIIHNRVVGVGITAEQARRAAQQIRPKDRATLLFIDKAGQARTTEPESTASLLPNWIDQHPLLQTVADILHEQSIEAYLVGGAVRDILLGRETIDDLDFTVPDNGLIVARHVANKLNAAFYPLDSERGTGRVVYEVEQGVAIEQRHLDFATFRQPSLQGDLADRDFTINAMALDLTQPDTLIDPYKGQQDIEKQQIRVVGQDAFDNDPVRVLRAIRQASEFNFSLEAQTRRLLPNAAEKLSTISPERQRDELIKLLNTPNPNRSVQMLSHLGVLPHILPEIALLVGVEQTAPHHLDVFDHTLAALQVWQTL